METTHTQLHTHTSRYKLPSTLGGPRATIGKKLQAPGGGGIGGGGKDTSSLGPGARRLLWQFDNVFASPPAMST